MGLDRTNVLSKHTLKASEQWKKLIFIAIKGMKCTLCTLALTSPSFPGEDPWNTVGIFLLSVRKVYNSSSLGPSFCISELFFLHCLHLTWEMLSFVTGSFTAQAPFLWFVCSHLPVYWWPNSAPVLLTFLCTHQLPPEAKILSWVSHYTWTSSSCFPDGQVF